MYVHNNAKIFILTLFLLGALFSITYAKEKVTITAVPHKKYN